MKIVLKELRETFICLKIIERTKLNKSLTKVANAALSGVAVIPIAGYGANGVKWGGKLWTKIGGCVGGSNLRGINYCRVLSFAVKASGKVRWVGGEGKLKKTNC